MKGRLKTVYEAIGESEYVSATDFQKLYEEHEKALNKIETMETSAKNAWDEWCKLSEENQRLKEHVKAANRRIEDLTGTANEYARIIQS